MTLAQRVSRILAPHYPATLSSLGIKAIPGGGVSVCPIMVAETAGLSASPVRRTPEQGGLSGVDVVGTSAVFGFGTWIPLLPRSLRARLNVQDITETLLEQIVAAGDQPSPLADAKVHTKIAGDHVQVVVTTPDAPRPIISFDVPVRNCL